MSKKITISEMRDLLSTRRGAQFVTIVALTIPPMNKTGNPYYDKATKLFRVEKESEVNGVVNWNYENAVTAQRIREGHPEPLFAAEPRKWGSRVIGTPFVVHNVNDEVRTYLEMKVEKIIDGPPIYYLDHEVIEDAKTLAHVKSWITPSKQAATQETKKEIIIRDYNLKTIKLIRFGGVEYGVTL